MAGALVGAVAGGTAGAVTGDGVRTGSGARGGTAIGAMPLSAGPCAGGRLSCGRRNPSGGPCTSCAANGAATPAASIKAKFLISDGTMALCSAQMERE